MVPQQQRRRRRRAALPRTAERRVIVARGAGGFGFTIAGQRPCVVSAVAVGGPADRAGLRAGDALLAVDGASVSRAPHAAVARLVAAAPQAISLSVAPRESPPTDTEDTEPDERARTRRRHPPPRRRPQQPPVLHHPGCHAAPSTSTVNEILHNLSRAQLSPSTHAARLECRAVVGYLGTIETPRAASETPPGSVKTAVRRLRQERRPAANVLLSVLPNVLILRRPTGQTLAQYPRERIVYAGCSSDADRRYFGLVTAAELAENETEISYSCHVFAVDSRLAEHEAHINRAREFHISCTRDPVAERCLEFPPSAEYVVGVIKGMYSLPADECASPALQQLSKLTVKGDSPALGNFSRCNRPALRMPRNLRRPNCRHEENRLEGPEFVANSPQPSNHSEVTTTSSNSDSGIGFHNDGRNVAERILVVDFAGQPQPINRYRPELPRRPMGMVGCNFEDASFLSNTTPVVDGFGGQGRPLNHLDDVMLNPNDLQHLGRYIGNQNRVEETRPSDTYNYNNGHYSNIPSSSRTHPNGAFYDPVYTEGENQYELIPPQMDDLELDRVTEACNSVEIYEERRQQVESCPSNEADSVENVTVISGTASKASMDSVSVYSSRSHEEARPARRKHLQASLDDMLVLAMRDQQASEDMNDEDKFVHPASVKCKVRKSKPMNLLARTARILRGRRELSASEGDVCAGDACAGDDARASSEPDLTLDPSEQSSPFRRWTTGSGAGSSYRHHDHRNIYNNKQMSDGTPPASVPSNGSNGCNGGGGGGSGGVARWSLGLEQLLADPAGAAAFAHFLQNEFAAENIRFWWSCEQYKSCEDESARSALAQQIWSRHLADGAPEPVNVDAAARRAAALSVCHQPPPPELFLHAQKQIFNVMKFDSYPRFLRSGVHAECARADLRGLPQPYAPRPSTDTTPNKLKKSASNASERRRSGGASLLPWKLRAASKDRAQSQSANNVNTSILPEAPPPAASQPQSVTDVVKSTNGVASVSVGGSGPGCSLCRVVLPDGATSVVGVDAGVPVRRLVDRLLQRRNLLCTSYDVLLRDGNQGEATLVDSQSPSTVLGGREAVVERRCVVRLEVCGRCVAVRCRPHRRLRHALRPVLQRYCGQRPPPEPLVLRENRTTVHIDTLMQELDGARLQVLVGEEPPCDVTKMAAPCDVTNNMAASCDVTNNMAAARPCDEDADSLSELAVRLNDDCDNQSGVSSTSRSECGSTCGGGGGGVPGAGAGAGRVKVALRPGASLHHHPPDFLDNLRETQRVRLGTVAGGTAAGSGGSPAEPRAPPPPLPPKPRPAVQAPAIV